MLDALLHRLVITGQKDALAVHRFLQSGCALLFQGCHKTVIGFVEFFDSFVLKLLGDLVDINAQVGQSGHYFIGQAQIFLDPFGRLPVIAISLDGFLRQCVDGFRSDQGFHIFDVRIFRILGTGTGPQHPLSAGAGFGQRRKTTTVKYFLIDLVGFTGAGQGYPAVAAFGQVRVLPSVFAYFFKPGVHQHIDTA